MTVQSDGMTCKEPWKVKLCNRKEGFQRDMTIANGYFQGNKKYRKKVVGNGLIGGNGDSI